MPNLPWDIIVILVITYVLLALLLAKVSKVLGHSIVWAKALFEPLQPFQPRPAVIAAAQRGLRDGYQRHDAE